MRQKSAQEIKNINPKQVTDTNDDELSRYHRIKKIMEEAEGKNLFADIKDPSEWQRELRKEWDRDFDDIR